MNSKRLDVLGLDLKMQEARLVYGDKRVPRWLSLSIDAIAWLTDQPSVLTYEDLIFINPPEGIRTLTTGETGKTEAMFYGAHLLIEQNLERATEKVRAAILCESPEERIQRLEGTEDCLSPVVEGVRALGNIPPEHFGEFVGHLDAHAKYRKHRIPNGGFSAGFHVLEILLRGCDLPLKYLWYFEDNRVYFPRKGRRQLQQALELTREHGGLASISERAGSVLLTERVTALKKFFIEFRTAHYGTVARQEPEILSGEGEESDYGEFLRERIKDTLRP